MTYFQKNMAELGKRFPAVCEFTAAAPDDGSIEACETRSGDSVPAVTVEGRRFFVHSRVDPEREAERFIGEINTAAHDLFIVFGFGFGYHVRELLKGMGPGSIVLVIEKRAQMLRKAAESRDLAGLFADPRLIMSLDPSDDDISVLLKGAASRRSCLILHRGSFRADPDYYANMQEIARSYLSTKDVNIATLAKFERVWASNMARNIVDYARSPGANIFFDRFKGVPAIVVCAGPSLRNSIDFIRARRDDCVIVAVDTAYRILQNEGIDPHFCVVVDPQVINARYFEGSRESGAVLVADPTVHPSVFRLFNGRVAVTGVAFNLVKWMETIAGEKGEITHGGSVSTNAYDFARRLGADPVVLVGQDLAFTGGYAHARGSYLDEQVHLRSSRLYTVEMFNRFQLTALPKIFVKGIRSETVHTNQKMMIFLNWFEKRHDPSLVNATHDGARIPGVRHADADSIAVPAHGPNIGARIDGIYETANAGGRINEIRRGLADRVAAILGEIDELIPALERATLLAESLAGLMAAGGSGRGKIDRILDALAETDRLVESRAHAADMISFTIQRVVHTITEGYDISGDEASMAGGERVANRSRYLYQGLLDGARFNCKILKKMAIALEQGAD